MFNEVFFVFLFYGSFGDYVNVLFYIVVNWSILFWEWYVDGSSKDIFWFVLLVFDSLDGVVFELKIISFKVLKDLVVVNYYFDFEKEEG